MTFSLVVLATTSSMVALVLIQQIMGVRQLGSLSIYEHVLLCEMALTPLYPLKMLKVAKVMTQSLAILATTF